MTLALLGILVPVAGALVAFSWRSERSRPLWLPVVAAVHLAVTISAVVAHPQPSAGRWLMLDPPGRLVLLLVSTLFAVVSVYGVGYLRERSERPNRIFCACLMLFLGMMTFIVWAHHLGLMWVALEATTLSCGPLLYFNRNARSLEATWKYLMVGSVGIALALLGSFFLGYAAVQAGGEPSLLFDDLVRNAPGFSKSWLQAAFVLLVVGYGTKMGLAPMHTWKPDAYGEAPGIVGALMAGALTSCAFLALSRVFHVLTAAGEGAFAGRILVVLGLFSMAVAGVFTVRQRDLKRMLAYSSVEHMGILAFGLGLGGSAIFGAFLHMLNNGIIKGVMFLSAGNIHRAYDSKYVEDVSGALRRVPWSGALFLAGFFAVTGSPPFGPFVSELSILNAAMEQHRWGVAAAMLGLLLIVFMGMGVTVLGVVQGEAAPSSSPSRFRDGILNTLPALVLLAMSFGMGVAMPDAIQSMVREAADYVGGRR
jgi:hydrogenase-4 component F